MADRYEEIKARYWPRGRGCGPEEQVRADLAWLVVEIDRLRQLLRDVKPWLSTEKGSGKLGELFVTVAEIERALGERDDADE